MKKDIVVTWECKECDTNCKLTFKDNFELMDEFPPVDCPFVQNPEPLCINPKWKLLHNIQVV